MQKAGEKLAEQTQFIWSFSKLDIVHRDRKQPLKSSQVVLWTLGREATMTLTAWLTAQKEKTILFSEIEVCVCVINGAGLGVKTWKRLVNESQGDVLNLQGGL